LTVCLDIKKGGLKKWPFAVSYLEGQNNDKEKG
jgi:hypothetical protein